MRRSCPSRAWRPGPPGEHREEHRMALPAEVRERFLERLAEHGNASRATAELGLGSRTPYQWRDRDPGLRAGVGGGAGPVQVRPAGPRGGNRGGARGRRLGAGDRRRGRAPVRGRPRRRLGAGPQARHAAQNGARGREGPGKAHGQDDARRGREGGPEEPAARHRRPAARHAAP